MPHTKSIRPKVSSPLSSHTISKSIAPSPQRESVTVRRLRKALTAAESYARWREIAAELDQHRGGEIWRGEADSEFFSGSLIREHIEEMSRLRRAQSYEALIDLLQESLYRHLAEISNPLLYQVALCGTKNLIGEFLDEAERAMEYLCEAELPGLSNAEKLHNFQLAFHNFGRSALLLSGGLAFGIYHTGVVKALLDEDLLPRVISGSSMGSIVAAAACSRTDEELREMVHRPETIHRTALKWLRPRQILHERMVFAPQQLTEHIEANVGRMTFAETYAHSGRILNITVSPTRIRQKPRVLNYMTAPNVLACSAAQASCAIPVAFPPVQLQARNRAGAIVPYMSTERWIDGSVHADIPVVRLGRLHNVNHTIVSQANPHVLPFTSQRHCSGLVPTARHVVTSLAQAQAAEFLEATRNSWARSFLRAPLEKAYAVARQNYLGDINIQFPFQPLLYRRVAANPDLDGVKLFIRLGEQATWPQLAMIRDQTRISRCFERCIERLQRTSRG